eukprot:scaffold16042_cov101-Isochrysis_galbana.AAC.1
MQLVQVHRDGGEGLHVGVARYPGQLHVCRGSRAIRRAPAVHLARPRRHFHAKELRHNLDHGRRPTSRHLCAKQMQEHLVDLGRVVVGVMEALFRRLSDRFIIVSERDRLGQRRARLRQLCLELFDGQVLPPRLLGILPKHKAGRCLAGDVLREGLRRRCRLLLRELCSPTIEISLSEGALPGASPPRELADPISSRCATSSSRPPTRCDSRISILSSRRATFAWSPMHSPSSSTQRLCSTRRWRRCSSRNEPSCAVASRCKRRRSSSAAVAASFEADLSCRMSDLAARNPSSTCRLQASRLAWAAAAVASRAADAAAAAAAATSRTCTCRADASASAAATVARRSACCSRRSAEAAATFAATSSTRKASEIRICARRRRCSSRSAFRCRCGTQPDLAP